MGEQSVICHVAVYYHNGIMDNGKVAVAQRFCACASYDTKITQKTDLMTLYSMGNLVCGDTSPLILL